MAVKNDIDELITPLVEDLGYEYVGIEFNNHPSNGLLRIYIDQPERGVGLKDCETVSREVSALLDVHDPIKGQYRLEVSSPGLDRPLFTVEHFQRFVGQQVKLTSSIPVDGQRKFKGTIVGVEEGFVVIDEDGNTVRVDHGNIVKARLVPQF